MRQLSALRFRQQLLPATARCIQLIDEKLPVSISLGLWTTLLTYLISIPLGIRKAVRDGSAFDVWTSARHHRRLRHSRLPVRRPADRALRRRQLSSSGSRCAASSRTTGRALGLAAQIVDYFWHIALPVLSLVIGGFASLTMLTKNSFLEEINKQYVVTARAKGLSRAARALRPRLPQRDAAGDRRLSGGLHRHPVHRRAAGRGHLLARRARPARLRGGDRPRLSDHVRHALHLHADRPRAEAHQRPHLHAGRSAHRFRARGEAHRSDAALTPR